MNGISMPTRRRIQASASEERLYNLLADRAIPGADTDAIDQRIWDLFGEELAIMFTDLAGFSKLSAEFGILHFLQTIVLSQKILFPVLEDHDGILLKTEADSFLALFRNPLKAVKCAVAMQNTLKEFNATKTTEEQVLLCVGLGYGKVLKIGDTDVFGSEVNFASKLGEDIAKSGEILLTENLAGLCAEHWNLIERSEKLFQTTRTFKLAY
jgi:adenylate cyclase